MNKTINQRQIILIICILVAVIAIIFVTLIIIGRNYRKGLSTYESPKIQTNVNLDQATDIGGMTFRKKGEQECVSISTDGQVRIYDVCDKDQSSTYRTTNLRGLNRLFDMIKSGNLDKTKTTGAYEITIHTNKGDVTYYFDDSDLKGGGNDGGGNGIIDIIEDIKNDNPDKGITPTPIITTTFEITSTLMPSIINSPYVTPFPTPSPEDGVEIDKKSFTCDFTDSGSKKPYRVSNVVCSTEPQDPK
jgi:hypothetical protein